MHFSAHLPILVLIEINDQLIAYVGKVKIVTNFPSLSASHFFYCLLSYREIEHNNVSM